MFIQRGCVWLSTSCFFCSLYISFFFISSFLESVGFSPEKAGIGLGLYGLAMIPTRIVIGIVSSRTGAGKGLIQLGLTTLLVGLLVVFAPIVGLLTVDVAMMLHRALLGVGASFYVIYVTIFKSFFAKGEIPKAMAWITAAYAMPQIVATLIGGFSIGRWGWQAPFVIGFGTCVLALVLISLVKDQDRSTERRPVRIQELVGEAWNAKLMVASLLAAICFFIAFATYYGFAQNWAMRELGVDEQGLSWLMLAMLVPFAGTLLASGLIQEFLGTRLTLVSGMGLLGLGVMMIPASASLSALMSWYMVGGVGFGLAFPTTMALSVQGVEERLVPWATALYQCIYALGIMLGPTVGGIVVSNLDFSWAFLALGMVAFAAIIPIAWLKQEVGVLLAPAVR